MSRLADLTMTAVLHLLPPVLTIGLSVVVGLWIWRTRRHVRGVGLYLLLIAIAGVAWQLQLITHVLTDEWLVARFIVSSEKFTGYVASVVWVLFVAEYTNADFHRERWAQLLFGAILVSYAFLATTNPGHSLLFADIVRVDAPFLHGSAVRGPLYWIYLSMTYMWVVTGIYVLWRFFSRTRRSTRLPIALLAIGALGVGTFNLSSIAGLGPISTFQYGGYGAFPFLLVSTVGVFKLGLLDLAPVARTTLVDSLDDAVLVIDGTDRVVDFNRSARRLWPALATAEGGQFDAVCPALAEQVELRGETQRRPDSVTLTVDGDIHHYSLLVSPVASADGQPGPQGYTLLLRDVTEREQSRRRLEAQNERLDRVAATVSHDLRNPLTVATGHRELLEAELDADHLESHLDGIAAAHTRMETIISDVLSLARHGDSVDDLAPVALPAVAEAAWATVETGDATLSVGTDASVMADRSRLQTVLENLFRNSVDHGQGDGESVTVRVESTADAFAVEDDGPGIPAAERDRIFEAGYSTTASGTGYGLHIVDQVARAHGWEVALTESDAGGVRFEFTGVDRPA